jgi:hypothetical protein
MAMPVADSGLAAWDSLIADSLPSAARHVALDELLDGNGQARPPAATGVFNGKVGEGLMGWESAEGLLHLLQPTSHECDSLLKELLVNGELKVVDTFKRFDGES